MLPDFQRADRIGEFWGYPESRAFAELLIDCEEDRMLRAVLVGMLREGSRGRQCASRARVARRGLPSKLAWCACDCDGWLRQHWKAASPPSNW